MFPHDGGRNLSPPLNEVNGKVGCNGSTDEEITQHCLMEVSTTCGGGWVLGSSIRFGVPPEIVLLTVRSY